MAIEKIDECVNCGLPCLGDACPRMNVVKCTCDDCGKTFEPEELYVYEDDMLCEPCLLNKFRTVAQEGLIDG